MEQKPRGLENDWPLLLGAAAAIGFLVWLGLQIWGHVTRENLPDHCANGCAVSLPWIADHPIWTGLIAFAVSAFIGRILIFMSAMESRDK